MADPLGSADEVTILEGSSFCRSDRAGNISPQRAHGIFVKDTRLISGWQLLLDDEPLEPLGVASTDPFSATFLCRAPSRFHGREPTVVVERCRMINYDLREDITVRNYGHETLGATLTLLVDGDFADLFDVKDGRHRAGHIAHSRTDTTDLLLSATVAGRDRGVRVRSADGIAARGSITWHLAVPRSESWSTSVDVLPIEDGSEAESSFPIDHPLDTTAPSMRMRDRQASMPHISSEYAALQTVLQRSLADVGALRIADSARPDLDVVAAGAPWFMALFGRDSLITSWLTVPWDLSLARGTLHTLARLQGQQEDAYSEEDPGKILHEVRLGMDEDRALGGSSIYYGSVDATPLFVMLLGRAAQWGLPRKDLEQLIPHADRAIEWIERYGDLDGDGFVEYQRKTDRGLLNQGWKDSEDSINFATGELAHGSIALSEVQGYAYAAYEARALVAELVGDQDTASRCRAKAADLQARFEDSFWLPDRGYYAIALDGDKRPVDALASNQGHLLWTGIVPDGRAKQVAATLVGPGLFSGWGLRTLASSMGAYNPISYHNGSVWPHDNALAVEGLLRYQLVEAAHHIAEALIESAVAFSGRLPELFCGFSRHHLPVPVPYPTSCSPQAWAAAAPLGIVAALLRLKPDADTGRIDHTSVLPEAWGKLHITGMPIGEKRVDLHAG
ncbi:MAG: glycogen debranching N-terminal domain-containing protein [Aeromicrobium sp.]